jgi:hypothetical protein
VNLILLLLENYRSFFSLLVLDAEETFQIIGAAL